MIASIKRNINIPQWEVDNLELWFADLYAHGWKLKEIKGRNALFYQCESVNVKYYCHIFDKNNDKHEGNFDYKKHQIEKVEAQGWKYVSDYGQIGVFINQSNSNINYPVKCDDEINRIISLFLSTCGKIRIPWIGIVLSFISIVVGLANIHEILISPFLYIMVALLLYSLLKIPCFLIWRKLIISKIVNHYKKISPHMQQYIPTKRLLFKKDLKKASVTIIFVLLVIPVLPFFIQWIKYGNYPPIPNKDVPLLRLSDVKSGYYAIYKGSGEPGNFYKSYPGLIIPMYSTLAENDGTSWILSERYQTFSRWYANILSENVYPHAFLRNNIIEQPNEFNFDTIWATIDNDGGYVVVAVKDKTVYLLMCSHVSATLDEILLKMGSKK